jgi:hypothetical protein
VQLHQTAAHKEALKAAGMDVLKYDGMGEMHVKSLDDWIKFSSTPHFTEKMVRKYTPTDFCHFPVTNLFLSEGDGAEFMAGPIYVMAGYDNLIYGAKIETSGGSDGILPTDSRLTKESKL